VTGSALEHARRCLEIAEKLDNESSRTLGYGALGWAALVGGQPQDACEALRESVAIARAHNSQLSFVPELLAALSEAQLAVGERSDALATAREALALASGNGSSYFEAHAQIALASALLETDAGPPRAEIESALERAEQLVEAIEGRALLPRILEQRGRLAHALGDAKGASRALREALELYRELGATGHAERLARQNFAVSGFS
jgi:tetratricopeptide (TPR) repeat protein